MRTGGSSSSPLLGTYCGGSLPPSLNSNGNKMFIKFYSNRGDSTQLQGFSASYTSYLEGKTSKKYLCKMFLI